MRAFLLGLAMLLAAPFYAGCDDGADGDGDADSDGDVDGDSDGDGDGDSDSDGDVDGDSDSDADGPGPTDFEWPELDPPRTCAEVSHDYPCVEVTECGHLSESGRYYLLMNDVSSEGTCLLTTDDVVIDLNGHTLTFDEGYGDDADEGLDNPGFEGSDVGASGDGVAGWDLSGAPGAAVVDRWTMPLVGERSLSVPAGGVVITSWVRLPVGDRTYRGAIVQRGPGEPVNVTVERQVDGGGSEVVCTRDVTDPLGGGKAAFCNFHGQPAGLYRLRVTSPRSQYYDDAFLGPARSAGIGAVRYYTSYEEPDRPTHVCNLDDGTCHLPDSADAGGPTVDGGTITVRNGVIVAGSRGMKTFGFYVSGAALALERVIVQTSGVAAKTLQVGRVEAHDCFFEADMPWVIDRENISETSATVGSDSIIEGSVFLGGQGCLSMSGARGTVIRSSRFVNRATVTNHYAISLGGSDDVTIEDNTINCDEDAPGCVPFSGSGILFYRTRGSTVSGNTFYMVAAPCDAEYVDGTFTTNGIRMTDYNASVGADNGVFDNVVSGNAFDLRARSFSAMPDCDVYANGLFYSVGAGDNLLEDNTFTSTVYDEEAHSYAFYIGSANNGGVYEGNRVRTNARVAWFSSAYGPASSARFTGNVFERVENTYFTPEAPDAAFRIGYCCGYEANDLTLVGNDYQGGFDPDVFWFTSNQAAPYSLTVGWQARVTVTDGGGTPVEGATVALTAGGESSEATTDAAGVAVVSGTEYRQSGTNHRADTTADVTTVTPHELEVTAPGHTTSRQTLELTTNLDVAVTLE